MLMSLIVYAYIITYCNFAPQEPIRNAKDVKTSAHILPGSDGKEPVKIEAFEDLWVIYCSHEPDQVLSMLDTWISWMFKSDGATTIALCIYI